MREPLGAGVDADDRPVEQVSGDQEVRRHPLVSPRCADRPVEDPGEVQPVEGDDVDGDRHQRIAQDPGDPCVDQQHDPLARARERTGVPVRVLRVGGVRGAGVRPPVVRRQRPHRQRHDAAHREQGGDEQVQPHVQDHVHRELTVGVAVDARAGDHRDTEASDQPRYRAPDRPRVPAGVQPPHRRQVEHHHGDDERAEQDVHPPVRHQLGPGPFAGHVETDHPLLHAERPRGCGPVGVHHHRGGHRQGEQRRGLPGDEQAARTVATEAEVCDRGGGARRGQCREGDGGECAPPRRPGSAHGERDDADDGVREHGQAHPRQDQMAAGGDGGAAGRVAVAGEEGARGAEQHRQRHRDHEAEDPGAVMVGAVGQRADGGGQRGPGAPGHHAREPGLPGAGPPRGDRCGRCGQRRRGPGDAGAGAVGGVDGGGGEGGDGHPGERGVPGDGLRREVPAHPSGPVGVACDQGVGGGADGGRGEQDRRQVQRRGDHVPH